AGDVGVAGRIDGDGIAGVGAAAAQIGAVQQGVAGTVELGDEDIGGAGVAGLQAHLGGEVGGGGLAGDVGVAVAGRGDAVAVVGATAAQVAAVADAWIDDERLGGIVGADLEAGLVETADRLRDGHGQLVAAAVHLIDLRCLLDHGSAG